MVTWHQYFQQVVALRLQAHVYKINMPQTCPYDFSYKQAIKLLQKLVTQEVTQV